MSKINEYLGYAAFTVALVATAGSLSFSEILGWVPCVLCWYQRVMMYPLVFILGVAILRKDATWPYTVLPLAVVGWFIALYHSLLKWGVISESLAPCVGGVSCAAKGEMWFGFISIPFLAFTAFTMIIAFSLIQLKGLRNDKRS